MRSTKILANKIQLSHVVGIVKWQDEFTGDCFVKAKVDFSSVMQQSWHYGCSVNFTKVRNGSNK